VEGRGRNFKLETLSRAFLCLEITDAGAPCLERGGTFDSGERERGKGGRVAARGLVRGGEGARGEGRECAPARTDRSPNGFPCNAKTALQRPIIALLVCRSRCPPPCRGYPVVSAGSRRVSTTRGRGGER